jgi:hypothetical protein
MVNAAPSRWPSNSSVFDGGEPPRTVAVKYEVNGLLKGTLTGALTSPPG